MIIMRDCYLSLEQFRSQWIAAIKKYDLQVREMIFWPLLEKFESLVRECRLWIDLYLYVTYAEGNGVRLTVIHHQPSVAFPDCWTPLISQSLSEVGIRPGNSERLDLPNIPKSGVRRIVGVALLDRWGLFYTGRIVYPLWWLFIIYSSYLCSRNNWLGTSTYRFEHYRATPTWATRKKICFSLYQSWNIPQYGILMYVQYVCIITNQLLFLSCST